ncbi:MAG: PKD domain-containing protein, partial [Bacteroidales bacterium]|nr:PKD domain-containing protein [Bacteroidales bacterium]
MKKLFLIQTFVALMFTLSFSQTELSKAHDYLQRKGEVYFKFTVDQPTVLLELTSKISIDNLVGLEVFAYANQRGFSEFLEYEFPYEVLEHPGELINPEMHDASKGIWEFDTYPTYTEFVSMMYTFEANFPNLCKIHDIGATNDGRRLIFAEISDNVGTREAEPRFMYTGSMHGDETTGYILLLHMIDYLLNNYSSDSEVQGIVNNTELWIMPLENPDGTYAGGNNTVFGSTRSNANNVDLNRNFKNPVGGDHPDGEAWQIETIEMMALIDSLHFVMSANFHGGIELVNYPWDSWYSSDNMHADNDWWILVSEEYASSAQANSPAGYFEGLGDGVTHGADWYLVTGSRQDYTTYYGRGREFTLEVSDTKTIPASELIPHWNYNHQAMLDYMKQVQYGIRGIVTDACTGQPMVANIFITGHDKDNSDQYSEMPLGDYYRPILAGTYTLVFSAPGYVSQTFTNVSASNYSTTVLNVSLAPAAPVADFAADEVTTCTGLINFTSSASGVDTWSWNFGDGNTSTEENPTHTYTADGTYTVSLTVTNCAGLGTDTETKTSYIVVDLPTAPSSNDNYRCGTGTVTISSFGSGTINWYDSETGGTLLGTGNSFTTPSISSTTTYYAEDVTGTAALSYNVGETSSNASGGYHNAGGVYYIVFDAFAEFNLTSVEINAETAGTSTIALRNSSGGDIQTASVTHPAGISRVDLNFDVPIGTDMRLVLTSTNNHWRNNVEAVLNYPYEVAGVVSITNANTTNPLQFYYYFYDWEITIPGETCSSARTPVTATISNGATLTMSSTPESTPGANNGSASVNAIGTAPFLFNWSNGATISSISGLAQGTYCVTVTDNNGCQSTDCIDVEVGSVPLSSSTALISNATCSGLCNGSATATPTGGSGTYTFLWDNSETTATATALCSGTHTVTISDGSTSVTNSVSISQPTALALSSNSSSALCYGASTGSASVTVSGGTAPYSYLWSSGGNSATETNLAAGTYSVVVTDNNGCSDSETVTISQPTQITYNSTTNDASCGNSDGSASLSVSGGTASYSYLWSNGANTASVSALASGTYTCTITDANNCQISATVIINDLDGPTANISSSSNALCYGLAN